MHERVITVLMLLIAIIHLLPLSGVAGAERLGALYGIDIEDPNLEILMRHRAVLFGVLGLLFGYAAFTPGLQPLAFLIAAASVGSFFYLAFAVGGYNAALRTVVLADVVASLALVGAIVLYWIKPEPA